MTMEQPETETTNMLGDSTEMQGVLSNIRKTATTDVPVLLLGEKGTGKRLAARTIHQLGTRLKGPFTVVNCDSIPKDLMEVEFFGHEKGAFTGAHSQRKGCVERSHGGTLFFNDIHALPLSLQAALVRYLEEKSVVRVGASEEVRVDTRLVAASDQDLKHALEEGRFRDDLYFSFVTIAIPPLRDRTGDILQLARGFLTTLALKNRRRVFGFLDSAENAMSTYAWPGNVRELENRVRRAVVLAEGSQITPEDIQLSESKSILQQSCPTLKEAREALERRMIKEALIRGKGNLTRAAEELGVTRPTLYELMARLGIPRT
jgi:two-component system NtrC family response regulator